MVYLIILLFLLLCGGLAVLTILNITTQVHFTVFSWQSPDLPIGLWLLIAFFLGALLLYLVAVAEARSDRRELKNLRIRIAELDLQNREKTQSSGSAAAPQARRTGPLLRMPGGPPASPNPGGLQQDLPPQQFRQ